MTYEDAQKRIKKSPLNKFKVGQGAEESSIVTSSDVDSHPCFDSNCDDLANEPFSINPIMGEIAIDSQLE